MSEKRQNPYQRLMETARKFSGQVLYPICKSMWVYPMASLNGGWDLTRLYERTKAADQLGYDVLCIATDEGLKIQYRKRPDVPWELK